MGRNWRNYFAGFLYDWRHLLQEKLILILYFLTFTEEQRINLPREMWIEIWSFLDFKTLQKTCTLVSKTWFEEIRNSTKLSGEMTLKTSWPWWNVKGYFFDKKSILISTSNPEFLIYQFQKGFCLEN